MLSLYFHTVSQPKLTTFSPDLIDDWNHQTHSDDAPGLPQATAVEHRRQAHYSMTA